MGAARNGVGIKHREHRKGEDKPDSLDPAELTEWSTPKPFLGEDAYGRFAWVKLQNASQDINFIVHRGDSKDGTDADRKFNPATDGPEIWLKQGDATFYPSQAAAQGFVSIHYQRPDGVYNGWGLHLWGDALADDVGTADWIILSHVWDAWDEANSSVEPGSDRPNEVLRQNFCRYRSYGDSFELWQRRPAEGCPDELPPTPVETPPARD